MDQTDFVNMDALSREPRSNVLPHQLRVALAISLVDGLKEMWTQSWPTLKRVELSKLLSSTLEEGT